MKFASIVYTPAGPQSDYFFAHTGDLRTVFPLISFGDHPRSIFQVPSQAGKNMFWFAANAFRQGAILARSLGLEAVLYLENDSRAHGDNWDEKLFAQFQPKKILGHITAFGRVKPEIEQKLRDMRRRHPGSHPVYYRFTDRQAADCPVYPNGANTLMPVDLYYDISRQIQRTQPYDNAFGRIGAKMFGVDWLGMLDYLDHSFSFGRNVGWARDVKVQKLLSGQFVLGHQFKVGEAAYYDRAFKG